MKKMTNSWRPTSSAPEIMKQTDLKRGSRVVFLAKKESGRSIFVTEEHQRSSLDCNPFPTNSVPSHDLAMIVVSYLDRSFYSSECSQ